MVCTTTTCTETSMGVRLNVQRNPALEYACAVRRVSRNVVKRMVRPHHWNRLIYEHFSVSGRQNRRDLQTVHSFTKEVISRKRAEMAAAANEGKKEEEEVELQTKSGSKKRYAFLDLLLHLKEDTASGQNGWSDEALQEEVETLMVAGHESTAMTLTWTLLFAVRPMMGAGGKRRSDSLMTAFRYFRPLTALPR